MTMREYVLINKGMVGVADGQVAYSVSRCATRTSQSLMA